MKAPLWVAIAALFWFAGASAPAAAYPAAMTGTPCLRLADKLPVPADRTTLDGEDPQIHADIEAIAEKLGRSPEGKAAFSKAVIDGNVRGPQGDAAAVLSGIAAYFTESVSAKDLLEAPTPAEVEAVAKAMNKAHKGCKVPYRTAGHPDLKEGAAMSLSEPAKGLREVVYTVESQRVAQIISYFKNMSVLAGWRTAQVLLTERLGPEGYKEWLERNKAVEFVSVYEPAKSANALDAVYTDATSSAKGIPQDLHNLGVLAKAVLREPQVAALFGEYHKAIRAVMEVANVKADGGLDEAVARGNTPITAIRLRKSRAAADAQSSRVKALKDTSAQLRQILGARIATAYPELAPVAERLAQVMAPDLARVEM